MREKAANEEAAKGPEPTASEFERLAEQADRGLAAEFVFFLAHNKKWWLAPIVLALLLLSTIALLSGSFVAPLLQPLYTFW